jgi:hypothetical protein
MECEFIDLISHSSLVSGKCFKVSLYLRSLFLSRCIPYTECLDIKLILDITKTNARLLRFNLKAFDVLHAQLKLTFINYTAISVAY